MTCDGCVSNVKQALMELPDIAEADVQPKSQAVLLTMNQSIDTQVLQNRLAKAEPYTISNSYGDGNGIDDVSPDVERNQSFSNPHSERQTKPFGIDHEPGV